MSSEQIFSQLIINLRNLVDALSLTPDVADALIPDGKPHEGEKQLWDYKEKLPRLPEKATDDDRKIFNAELGDLIKDAVSFHNAYGGYIVFGVTDKGKDRIKGIECDFDCADFNKRLNSYIGDNPIECDYRSMGVFAPNGEQRNIGFLLIPRRATGAIPVRFLKEGPLKINGGKCFNKETYVRIRDECRPAASISSDWVFLHSDRSPPGQRITEYRSNRISSSLPARDPDLVEFLGRSGALAKLREWIADPRSPVRLITGIGGLGKTTLAYRFAEEVTELGAGAVEQVLWLAAKVRTYSALKGEMVAVGRVDFDDLMSLHREILHVLHYESPVDDDDVETEELEERIIEALNIVPCLIVVDDIDSLEPEEQRRVVSSMNGIGLRTVGRELASSKILMTSRIDQGLPQTSVLKLAGLERDVFGHYVSNIARLFGIPAIYGETLDELYESSSGSPLFSASIVRLVKLGEGIKQAIETWKGQDGEDVRAFAFKREIERLSSPDARLLLAVILLGETSIHDLATILEITPKIVRDRISRLQSYHLLATSIRGSGDATIFVPSDLISVKEILKRHLGSQAATVQEACAKAEERSQSNSKSIGLAIRKIISDWKEGRANDAVISARKLQSQHPTNGDAFSIYGAALLKVSPPRAKEADLVLESARKLGCGRPELSSYIIQAKKLLEDWQGLYELTKSLSSTELHRDIWLDAFIAACTGLIKTAKIRGDWKRVAVLAFEVVQRISSKMQRQTVAPSFFQRLISIRFDFAREYFDAVAHYSPRAGDQLEVFEAAIKLGEFEIYLSDILKRALSALILWWGDVEKRPVIDDLAREILLRQIRRLEKLERSISTLPKPNPELLLIISSTNHDLSFRGSSYGTSTH
ncbi:RNA-binding domain-containing protein [Phyllobacterium meliloti]|uniref:RNA-binding domain-containing protein n=1 Tax=Phyllobacterium meliloti TaxID=555317 RepID=UPI001D159D80|nr:RNA-binding domain-containing protein [Phyllobacterium sp. T1293]UGX85226.1 putative DNA binding domain-containing protein [Phyllobacterium sp. T1293]